MKNISRNLVEMLESAAAAYPGNTALVFGTKKVIYKELLGISKKLSAALYDLGVREFDKTALWLPNCPEFVYSFFAVLRLRAVVVPVNTMFRREEAKFVIEDSSSKILICSIDKLVDSENILSRINTLKYVISLPSPQDKAAFGFYELINEKKEFDKRINIEDNDTAQIMYTSGTTGRPKGACLSHKNLISNIKDCSSVIRVTHRDCFICVLPLFHSFASTVCMLLPIYSGAKIVLMRAVRPFKRVIRAILKHRVTVFVGVPSFYAILSEAKFPRFALFLSIFINPVRLCISGAAALPLSVSLKFTKRFKRPLLQGYGLTEASPVVSLNPLKGKRKPDSIGVVLPSVDVKVVDSQGKDLPKGDVGELLVRGPSVMKGYHNLSEATSMVLKEGWLYTGDSARIDDQGFIYIMGRLKEMINVRGLNVYPREIEDVLYRHPKVKETAVVGVNHKHRGEVPVAFVVKNGQVAEREIIGYLRANLASYKIPLKVFFRDSLPKNAAGKILKNDLQKEVEGVFQGTGVIPE